MTIFLLINFTIIKFKRQDDILQGINRLDYFQTISIFQVAKRDPNETNAFDPYGNTVTGNDSAYNDTFAFKHLESE